MFDPAKPLFFSGCNQLSINHQRRCAVGMIGIDADDDTHENSAGLA
jgi:hypothetical protein